MRRLVSSASAQEADRMAEQTFGYPEGLLMEEAGIRLQDHLELLEREGAWAPGPVVYLAGPGNNGGDAWVMARQAFLRGRRSVAVLSPLPPSSPLCLRQASWARAVGVPILAWGPDADSALGTAMVWVDGLWGAGLSSPLRPEGAQVLVHLEALRRELRKPVVALDVASGLWEGRSPSDPVLEAKWTLAAGPRKDFCYFPANRRASGILQDVPLAFPQEASATATLVEETDLPTLVPPVGPHDHKGRRGHVALVGGAPGMSGALVLAARSAAAAGAGLVSLGVDPELIPLVAPQVPAFQVRPAVEVLDLRSRYGAWVVGPGWGRGQERPSLLERLWATDLPLVLDADGLVAWVTMGRPSRPAPTVFTPHPGEFLRLGSNLNLEVDGAAALARDKGVTMVLKGSATWILGSDGRRAVWDGAEPALGTGGSGDCLSGVVGAFLAVGWGAYEAAVAAVALHGAAGKGLACQEGWFTADRLPSALASLALTCRTAPRPL